MAWIVLIISGVLETVWAAALNASHGLSRLWPSLLFVTALAVSMAGLGYAMRAIPVGTAYAVWVGIGAVGTALYGMLVLHEPATAGRLICLALIIGGVVGLRILS